MTDKVKEYMNKIMVELKAYADQLFSDMCTKKLTDQNVFAIVTSRFEKDYRQNIVKYCVLVNAEINKK